MKTLHVRFLRYSAFYTPLLLTLREGALEAEGLTATYDVAGPGRTVAEGLQDGSVQVAQSALAVSFAPAERGELLPFRHFATMNARDGFFLAARGAPEPFDWRWLEGKRVVVDTFFQPLALFEEALRVKGVRRASVDVVDAGDPVAMERAFREGLADAVHLQGPSPRQLEADGAGRVVACVGEAVGPVVFSTLCATSEWLATDEARGFVRAFRRGRLRAQSDEPSAVARDLAGFFPDVGQDALSKTVADYQRLGCWEGDIGISDALYERTVALFVRCGHLRGPVPRSAVTAPLPAD